MRSAALAPTGAGKLDDSSELRLEFLQGAWKLGYALEPWDPERRLRELTDPAFLVEEKRRRLAAGYEDMLVPQQLLLVDALNAPGYDEYVVEIVRRAAKTTTIFTWAFGRCLARPGYQVTFSAQSGVKTSARLREWKTRLDRTAPDPEAGLPPWRRGVTVSKAVQRQIALFGEELAPHAEEPTGRGFRILMGEVGKGIYFDNGAQFLGFKPDAEAYRGEGGDISWIDEAQELDADEGAELLAGIVPLQDTKPGAALVISGTAGEVRSGPLWERVDRLRSADPDMGGVDYAAPEDTPWEHIEAEETAMALLAGVHPGIGTLTTLEKMRKNWRKLAKPKWAREYVSLWPETYGETVIAGADWEACGMTSKAARPARVAFGLDIKPNGGVAAIAAAWRSSTGLAYIELVQHQAGTKWLAKKGYAPDDREGWLQYLSMKYRGCDIGYDDIGEGKATALEVSTLSPKPRLRPIPYSAFAAGCVQILREIQRGTLRHAHQNGFDEAVAVAAKREVRNERGMWMWTPSEPGADITPLVAATRALRNWDEKYARRTGNSNAPIMGA